MSIKIQTLDEILAEMGQPSSAKTGNTSPSQAHPQSSNPNQPTQPNKSAPSVQQHKHATTPNPPRTKKNPTHQKTLAKKPFKQDSHQKSSCDEDASKNKLATHHPTTKKSIVIPPIQQITYPISMDADGTSGQIGLAQILNNINPEPLSINDKKTNRLRWLAFYYLSRRELSQHELRQKLLAKEQDPTDVENLLIEFAEKGYQSDERCAHMLVRESLRKGRGKQHIRQLLRQARLDDAFDLEQILSTIGQDVADGTILEDDDEVDWLKLAVEARCKKYGNTLPQTPKEKARQLRFLQYRGFDYGICFDALKKTLADFNDG